jgi:hypothetical protein
LKRSSVRAALALEMGVSGRVVRMAMALPRMGRLEVAEAEVLGIAVAWFRRGFPYLFLTFKCDRR